MSTPPTPDLLQALANVLGLERDQVESLTTYPNYGADDVEPPDVEDPTDAECDEAADRYYDRT